MATHIPIDVLRDMEQRIKDIKSEARVCRLAERDKRTQAEVLENEAGRLEDMFDKWKVLFPRVTE